MEGNLRSDSEGIHHNSIQEREQLDHDQEEGLSRVDQRHAFHKETYLISGDYRFDLRAGKKENQDGSRISIISAKFHLNQKLLCMGMLYSWQKLFEFSALSTALGPVLCLTIVAPKTQFFIVWAIWSTSCWRRLNLKSSQNLWNILSEAQ